VSTQENQSSDGFDDAPANDVAPIDYFADPVVNDQEPATLERLSSMAVRAGELESEITAASVALAMLEEELNTIRRRHIPEIMEGLGMDSFKMSDGREVTVDNKINASISADNKPAAFAWLRDNKFDGIIKTSVDVAFGKGEAENAEKAAALLREAGFEPSVSENVHAMTLKSFVKERLEEGDEIPTDVFGIYEFKEAKIKSPKVKKVSTRK
jgi:hypothetical protein